MVFAKLTKTNFPFANFFPLTKYQNSSLSSAKIFPWNSIIKHRQRETNLFQFSSHAAEKKWRAQPISGERVKYEFKMHAIEFCIFCFFCSFYPILVIRGVTYIQFQYFVQFQQTCQKYRYRNIILLAKKKSNYIEKKQPKRVLNCRNRRKKGVKKMCAESMRKYRNFSNILKCIQIVASGKTIMKM